MVIGTKVADIARRGEHFLARQRLAIGGVRADHLGFLYSVGSPEAPSFGDVRSKLEVNTASPGFPQAYGGTGARHVCHFVSGILLPDCDARFGATNRGKLDAHFLAGVDGRIEALLPGRYVGRPAGTREYLEGSTPVGVEVDVRGQAVNHAQLGLLNPAVFLQVGVNAIRQVGFTIEPIHPKGRDDL
ncbi:hypothetical protein D3C76_1146530 [compost metagenome]